MVSSPVVRGQKSTDWVLALAGWDQGGHEAELKRLTTELGIPFTDIRTPTSDLPPSVAVPLRPSSVAVLRRVERTGRPPTSVLFLGPQFNEAKAACYHYCDAFVLPSFSEGLPMVILEAWAYGKPVIMTDACNLAEAFATNAALRIEPSAESIARGLDTLFQSSIADLQSTGLRGRALVAERFAWPKVAEGMKTVYGWLLGGGTAPDCVLAK